MGSHTSAEIKSVYSTAPAEWATKHSLGESYPSAEMQSAYFTAPPTQPIGLEYLGYEIKLHVRLLSWRLGVHFHYHYSQVHSDPK